jgi:hypothetical protein
MVNVLAVEAAGKIDVLREHVARVDPLTLSRV